MSSNRLVNNAQKNYITLEQCMTLFVQFNTSTFVDFANSNNN